MNNLQFHNLGVLMLVQTSSSSLLEQHETGGHTAQDSVPRAVGTGLSLLGLKERLDTALSIGFVLLVVSCAARDWA